MTIFYVNRIYSSNATSNSLLRRKGAYFSLEGRKTYHGLFTNGVFLNVFYKGDVRVEFIVHVVIGTCFLSTYGSRRDVDIRFFYGGSYYRIFLSSNTNAVRLDSLLGGQSSTTTYNGSSLLYYERSLCNFGLCSLL